MILQEDPSIDLDTPTGPMRTYVYRPVAPGRYPGLVFFSEIFQRTGPIKRTAALLAGHGFVVAVPEIFHDLETPGCEIAHDAAGADRGTGHCEEGIEKLPTKQSPEFARWLRPLPSTRARNDGVTPSRDFGWPKARLRARSQ